MVPKRSQKASQESSKIYTFRDLVFYVDSFTLRAYPPTCLYAPAIPAPPPISRDATLSPLLDRDPWGGDPRDPKGTQGIEWEPRGDQGVLGPKGPG